MAWGWRPGDWQIGGEYDRLRSQFYANTYRHLAGFGRALAAGMQAATQFETAFARMAEAFNRTETDYATFGARMVAVMNRRDDGE